MNREQYGVRYERCSLTNYDASRGNAAALAACRALIDGEIDSLLLTGPVGIGKTHLLVATGLAAIYAEYWPILDLCTALRHEIANGCWQVQERLRATRLLLLDDLGAERTTDFVLEALESVVDYRYRQQQRTGIATNLTLPQLAERYGNRIISRWIDRGRVVQMTGADYRAGDGGRP
jgi:DNA replication protein DnaC